MKKKVFMFFAVMSQSSLQSNWNYYVLIQMEFKDIEEFANTQENYVHKNKEPIYSL